MLWSLSETKTALTAHFTIKTLSGEKFPVCAFGKSLLNITEKSEELTVRSLIYSRPFTMQQSYSVLCHISRPSDMNGIDSYISHPSHDDPGKTPV